MKLPLDRIAEAHEAQERGKTISKILSEKGGHSEKTVTHRSGEPLPGMTLASAEKVDWLRERSTAQTT